MLSDAWEGDRTCLSTEHGLSTEPGLSSAQRVSAQRQPRGWAVRELKPALPASGWVASQLLFCHCELSVWLRVGVYSEHLHRCWNFVSQSPIGHV